MVRRGGMPLAVAAVVVLVTGCGMGEFASGRQQPPATAGSSVSITWLASPITQAPNDARQVLIDAFEKSHPSIKVNLISGPTSTDALRNTLRTRLAGTTTPDVYLGDLIWPAAFAFEHLALALDDHMTPDFWNRFTPGLIQGVTYQGSTYAAPFFRDQGLLYYRSDLLAQAGLPVPTTWEKLVEEAKALRDAGLVKYGFVWEGVAYEGLTCVWMEVMADAGGQVLNETGTRAAIDSPQSAKALRFLRTLLTDGVTPLDVTNFQEPQAAAMFDSGQAAFARNWNHAYDDARTSAVRDAVGVASLPTFAGRQPPGASTSGGWNLYVNPRTEHLAAALEFVRWMTDVVAQEIIAREYHEIPTNDRVLREPDLVAASPVLTAVTRTAPVARPAGTPAYPAVSRAIYSNVSDAILGRQRPEDALRLAGTQIDAALARGSP